MITINDESFLYDVQGLYTAFRMPDVPLTVEITETGVDVRLVLSEEGAAPERVIEERAALSPEETARKENKNIIKRTVYGVLSEYTKKTLPWGTLTGIRPVKLARMLLRDGSAENEAKAYMEETYLCSPEKASLAVRIAAGEQQVFSRLSAAPSLENTYSLYIGIPFCPSTCLYCSFPSYAIASYEGQVDAYLSALKKEIDYVAGEYDGKKELISVYFGGGTPTALSAAALSELLKYLDEALLYRYPALREYTVEAGRPDSITPEKLRVLRSHGVNRLSVNPQTMKEETLRLIGRHHTNADIRRAMAEARAAGFPVINMDIILGLPGETLSDVEETLRAVSEMKPDNLTVHSLALKRSARLNIEWESYRAYVMENSKRHMALSYRYAEALGMQPYYLYRQQQMAGNLENVGFAVPGTEGLYNMLIIEEAQDIVALGAGSACKRILWGEAPEGKVSRQPADGGEGQKKRIPLRTARCENVKDVRQYIERIDEMIERKRALYGDEG